MNRKTYTVLASFVISAVLLIFLFGKANADDIFEKLISLNPLYLSIAFICMAVAVFITGLRSLLIASVMFNLNLSFKNFLTFQKLNLASIFVNSIIPLALLGDVIRALSIIKIFKLEKAGVVCFVIFDRFFAFALACCLGAILSLSKLGLYSAFFCIPISVYAVVVFIQYFEPSFRNYAVAKFGPITRPVIQSLLSIKLTINAFVYLMVVNLFQWLFILISVWFIARGLDLHLETKHLWIVTIFSIIPASIPFFYNGWGGREASLVFLLVDNRYALTDVLLLSSLIGAIFTFTSILGAWSYFQITLKMDDESENTKHRSSG